jgi:hypothetical protein
MVHPAFRLADALFGLSETLDTIFHCGLVRNFTQFKGYFWSSLWTQYIAFVINVLRLDICVAGLLDLLEEHLDVPAEVGEITTVSPTRRTQSLELVGR